MIAGIDRDTDTAIYKDTDMIQRDTDKDRNTDTDNIEQQLR